MSKINCILFSFLIILLVSCSAKNLNIYISTDGNDNSAGSITHPVATIEKALKIVNLKKQTNRECKLVSIFFRNGIYRLKSGVFVENLCGDVRFKSYNNENVTIKGSKVLDQFSKILYRNNNANSEYFYIYEFDLPSNGITNFNPIKLSGFNGTDAPKDFTLKELYYNGKVMPLSRYPNNGYLSIKEIVNADYQKLIGIYFTDTRLIKWKNEPNVILHGYWKYNWADGYESVDLIDIVNKIIWLEPPYNLYGFEKNNKFVAYNLITEIDNPGEWAYDYKLKRLCFYPPQDQEGKIIEFSICKEPLVALINSQRITFENLNFEMGAAEAFKIIDCSEILIKNCNIKNFARDGIVINGGYNNSIINCEISDTGRGGIIAKGGNRETLTESNFIIENCHIHNLSRIDKTYTPAVWVDGVGTKISHCNFHNIPSSALRINGNNHLIEYNEIHNVVTESNDQGAIDMWGDPTFRGNIFKNNYIYKIGLENHDRANLAEGRAGIRFDDAICGNLVSGNIFRKCSNGVFGAVQIHGGKENIIENNIFFDCQSGISFTSWTANFWISYTKPWLTFFEKNKELYVKSYPLLKGINLNLNSNTIQNNLFFNCDNPTLRKTEEVIFRNNLNINRNLAKIDIDRNDIFKEFIIKEIKANNFIEIPINEIGLKSNY